VAQTLGLVGGIEVDPSTAAGAHRWAWSMAHAFADRAVLGDTDRSRALLPRLLSPARALELKASFSPDSMGPAERFGAHWVPDDHGTSHLSVVDAEGHAVALTTTINGNFGSWVVVPELGIVLNNEIDDFVTRPGTANLFGLVGSEDNLVAPGKQPLSSMSPTLVFDETGLLGAVGGSGGPRIASGVALVLGALGRGADPGTAVAAPRLHHQWMPFAVAIEPGLEPLEASLRAAGHEVRVEPFVSAIQAIWRGTDGGWLSGSDPRKGGAPAGF
jgi:gamma-glutamyltranspeptidase/glutathione hydrolase